MITIYFAIVAKASKTFLYKSEYHTMTLAHLHHMLMRVIYIYARTLLLFTKNKNKKKMK